MTTPAVAVLMAVHDGVPPTFLREAVDSILAQTYAPVALHVFLDGVRDPQIRAVLRDRSSYQASVHLYEHERRRGLAVCLNDLIKRLGQAYPYFARMDADDVAFPDRIAKQVAFMEDHPDVDILGGSIVDIDAQGRSLRHVRYPITHDEMLQFFRMRPTPIAHVTVMFRQSYFDKAGLYPPVALEDSLYWMQGFLAGCRFHNLPDPLVYVRRTPEFLRRRGGIRKQWEELRIKWTIVRRMRLGLAAYGYALAVFAVQLFPVPVKRRIYDRFR